MNKISPRPIAVITAFNAPAELAQRAHDLADQVDAVILVDDGTHSVSRLDISDPSVIIIELPDNVGIAAALNRGIQRAREMHATHILTMDQDSAVPRGYVAAALEWLELHADDQPAGVVPEKFGAFKVAAQGEPARALDPIQSGQLLPIESFDRIGEFNESLFIDVVDTEFTLRAHVAGHHFLVLPDSELDHSLGDRLPLKLFGRHLTLFGKKRYLYYHAPFRSYYVIRNGLALWRLHAKGNLGLLTRRTLGTLRSSVIAVAIFPDHRAQFVAISHGFIDGLRMRLGRIPAKTTQAIARNRQ